MTKEDVDELDHGVYRLYWTTKSYSLACVGSLHDGSRWFACSNWTSENTSGIVGYGKQWEKVLKAKLIERRT